MLSCASPEVSIAASADDGYEHTATNGSRITDNELHVTRLSGGDDHWAGFRWEIPTANQEELAGSTILLAYIEVYITEVTAGVDQEEVVQFEDSANPAQFTTADNDITGRSYGAEGGTFTIRLSGDKNTVVRSGPLASLLQTLVNDHAPSAIVATIHPSSNTAVGSVRHTSIRAYDNGSGTFALLHIDYTPTGSSMSRTRTELRQQTAEQFPLPRVEGTSGTGSTTTLVHTPDLARYPDDRLVGMHIYIRGGTDANFPFRHPLITDSVQSTGTLTFIPQIANVSR